MATHKDLQNAVSALPQGQVYRDADGVTGTGQNDFVSARNDDNTLDGGAGHDVMHGGHGGDGMTGGSGDDFVQSGRGNDIMDGGEGNDTFGAVAGSNVITTGTGADTILLTVQQKKMEARNKDAAAAGEDGDHYTTVVDFTVGEDRIWLTKAGDASNLNFYTDAGGGIYAETAMGNTIFHLANVAYTAQNVQAVIDNMAFGQYDWNAEKIATLSKPVEVPLDDPPAFGDENVMADLMASVNKPHADLKDKNSVITHFDFADDNRRVVEKGNGDIFYKGGDGFFHGSVSQTSADVKEMLSGSSIKETEVDQFVFKLAAEVNGETDLEGIEIVALTEDGFAVEIDNGRAVDTIIFTGEVVELAMAEHFDIFA